MAQTGYSVLSLYYSATATNVPTAGNLVAGELAINTADGKLFYKDSAGVVQTIASKAGNLNVSSFSGGTTGLTPSTATTGVVTLAGTLAVANGGTGGTTSTGSGAVVLATSPTVTTPTIDKINTSVANTSLGAGNASIMKNRIINGAMVIDQRNAGAAVSINGTTSYVTDRFKITTGGGGIISASRSTTAPTGFVNSLSNTVSTADSSIAAGDIYVIDQIIEGYNTADLGFGTANAKTVTLSFWVNSSVTGTYGVRICNGSFNRSYVSTYTVNLANTWEQKTVTIAGDTTGTWATDNTNGIAVSWDLGSGTNWNTTANAWQAGNYLRTSGCVNWIATAGATFYITGVQLEVGSSATGFEYVNYQTSLANCQRYLYAVDSNGLSSGIGSSTTEVWINTFYPTRLRAGPTVTVSGSIQISNNTTADYTSTSPAIVVSQGTSVGSRTKINGFTGLTLGVAYAGYSTGTPSGQLFYSAEL